MNGASMMNAAAQAAAEAKAAGLVVGKNYGGCFGLDKDKGQTMVYDGDDTWTATNGGKSQTQKNPAISAKVRKYLGWE